MTGAKINTQSLQSLYIKNEHVETEIKNCTIYNGSKESEIIRFNSKKTIHNLCTENNKMLQKEIKKTKTNGET